MERRKLEALAEAVIAYSGYLNPDSELYAVRNPGGLKGIGVSHPKDDHGNRVFNSLIDGLQALLYDVELKVTGKSRAHLKPDHTLIDLSNAYNVPITTAQAWSRFLRKALRDESVNAKTPLKYFLED